MYGIDIAKNRFDEQDKQIFKHVLTQNWNPKTCLILGSGQGRIGIVLALLGFEVTCVDIDDYASYYEEANTLFDFSKPITFIKKDISTYVSGEYKKEFSLIIMQRVLHYLPDVLPGYMSKGAYLYFAISCIDSALGEGYEGREVEIENRFHVLSADCLHSLSDCKTLMKKSHFKKKKLYQTAFGNIKGFYQKKS